MITDRIEKIIRIGETLNLLSDCAQSVSSYKTFSQNPEVELV